MEARAKDSGHAGVRDEAPDGELPAADAHRIERFRRGGPPCDLEGLTSEIGRWLASAMLGCADEDRDGALNRHIDALPAARARAVKGALFRVHIDGPTPCEDWPEPEELPAAPPGPPLDRGMLPAPLGPWIEDVADHACIPLAYLAVPALVGAGSVVGRSIGIRPSPYDEFYTVPNLWGAIVGPPGMMKSWAVSQGLWPLHSLADQARKRHQEAAPEAQAARAFREAEVDAIKAEMGKAAKTGEGDPDGLRSRLAAKLAELQDATARERRYMTQDATVAKFGELLRDNPRGMLLSRDELAGWIRSAGFAITEQHQRDPYPQEHQTPRLYVWAVAA